MAINDHGKLFLLALALILATVLGVVGVFSGEVVAGLFLVVIGYVTGNGVLAIRGKSPSPLLSPRDDDQGT